MKIYTYSQVLARQLDSIADYAIWGMMAPTAWYDPEYAMVPSTLLDRAREAAMKVAALQESPIERWMKKSWNGCTTYNENYSGKLAPSFIWVDKDLDDTLKARTLFHEVGHCVMHPTGGKAKPVWLREIEAESFSWTMMALHDFDITSQSYQYMRMYMGVSRRISPSLSSVILPKALALYNTIY